MPHNNSTGYKGGLLRPMPFLILFLFFAQALYAQVELSPKITEVKVSPFWVDTASFMDENGNTYLEIYYQISNASLKFIRLHGEYIASFEITIAVYDKDGKWVTGDAFEEDILAKTYTESNLRSRIFIKTLRIPIGAGKFKLVVSIKDQDSKLINEVTKSIRVPNYANAKGVVVSDRVFGSAIEKIGNQNIIKPNPLRVYGDLNPTLIFYYEIYNNHLSKKRYLIHCELINRFGQVQSSVEKELDIMGERVFRNHIQFNVGELLAGKYTLRSKIKEIDGLGEVDLLDSFIIDRLLSWMPNDYYKTISLLKYIATDEEMKRLRNVEKSKRREAWLDFWKLKDPTPGTIENELMMEYYRRIRYANDNFSVLREGWTTDRGKIYIKYGPPDEVERHSFQFTRVYGMDARQKGKPFELWYYYRINRKFHFVDKNGNGEYFLVPLDWDDPYNRTGSGME